MQKKLLETQEGDLVLSELGVDGLVVAAESGLAPQSINEWDLVFESEEGKVYHRRDSRRMAEAPRKVETRNAVVYSLPTVEKPETLLFSRPLSPG